MTTTKPRFAVELSDNALSSLVAHPCLASLDPSIGYHLSRQLRLPLGIYNVSIARVADRLLSFCQRVERYFVAAKTISELAGQRQLRVELIDYLELAIYAAAEHVDDLESIACGFHRSTQVANKNEDYRRFIGQVKRLKKFLASVANAIKHKQSRVRLFSCEFRQGELQGCLHGYFVEGVENGAVGPDKAFHSQQPVFSITTLAWEIIVFILSCSWALRAFIDPRFGSSKVNSREQSRQFDEAVVAAARLPLYTFGEDHPFDRTLVSVSAANGYEHRLRSTLFGTIHSPWKVDILPIIRGARSEYEGDSATKTYKLIQPKHFVLRTWR